MQSTVPAARTSSHHHTIKSKMLPLLALSLSAVAAYEPKWPRFSWDTVRNTPATAHCEKLLKTTAQRALPLAARCGCRVPWMLLFHQSHGLMRAVLVPVPHPPGITCQQSHAGRALANKGLCTAVEPCRPHHAQIEQHLE